MRAVLAIFVVFSALVHVACSQSRQPAGQAEPVGTEQAQVGSSPRPAADTRPVLVAFGDSLTAGYRVPREANYPSLLQAELDARGYNYRVVNAGVSGDTTSSGLQRMRQVLSLKPSIVLLELGGNDGLRGLPIEVTRSNLEEMIVALRDAGATVALAGMTLPRNYGQTYIRQFEELYRSLAAKYRLRLVPFEIEPLAARGMLQDDGIHPTADGYRAALPRIFSELAPLLIK